MAKKEKELETIEKIEIVEKTEKVEKVQEEQFHEFVVLKEFTLDKIYNKTSVFKSNSTETIRFLLTNKFIK